MVVIFFCHEFFSVNTLTHEPAALSFMKFCTNVYLDTPSIFKVTGLDYHIFHHCEIKQKRS